MIRTIYGRSPKIAETAKLFESTNVYGNVTIGEYCSLYPGATIRAEGKEPVILGEGTNLQEHVTLHTQTGHPVLIGKNVTIGHGAIVHGCTISDNTLIGMGAIIQNGAKIESYCLIGAASLVPSHMVVPSGYLAYGVPARLIRLLTLEERQHIDDAAAEYRKITKEYEKTEKEPLF